MPYQMSHVRSLQQHWSALTTTVLVMLIGLVLLRATALAQPHYTYQTIDVPWAPYGVTSVTGITDLGKLVGTYAGSDIGPYGSWTWINAKEGFRKVSFKDKLIVLQDMNGSTRAVGVYYPMKYGSMTGPAKAMTLHSGRLTTLVMPPLKSVSDCAINDAHDIICTGINADGLNQAVRVKGATPGVLETYDAGVSIFGLNGARDVVGVIWDHATITYRGYYRHAASGATAYIDAPCGQDTVIVDISLTPRAAVQCGDWLGGGFDGSPRSYAFDGVTWTELSVPGSPATLVSRVNNSGQFVGMYQDPSPELELVWHGFIATPTLGTLVSQR